jgi:hypothetical protein
MVMRFGSTASSLKSLALLDLSASFHTLHKNQSLA